MPDSRANNKPKPIHDRDLGYSRGLRGDIINSISKTNNNNEESTITSSYDPDSKYARAARLGLCFKCMREDTNPDHRPRHRTFAYCKECDEAFSIGTEKLVIKAQNEVSRWFPDH